MIPALTLVLTFTCLLLLFGFDCYLAVVAASSASRPAIIAAHTYRREREGKSIKRREYFLICVSETAGSLSSNRPGNRSAGRAKYGRQRLDSGAQSNYALRR